MVKNKSAFWPVRVIPIIWVVLFGLAACGSGSNDLTNNGEGIPESIDITGYSIDPTEPYAEALNNVYYLDANPENGDDGSGDGSSSNPWQTLAKVFTVMTSGDTIILRTGNYERFSQNNSGDRTDWITFKADTGHTPVIAGLGLNNASLTNAYLRFDNIDFSFGDANSTFGVNLRYVRHIEIRNSNISNYNHKYETNTAVRIIRSENILLYNCDISKATTAITVLNTHNVTFSRNHIHGLGGGTGFQYAGGNGNFIIEKNNVYDSNFDTNDVDPDSPYTPDNSGGWPHSSAISIRSNDVWIRGNIFHDIGSSSGIMFYTPDAAGGETAYRNIIMENNLLYDIHNYFVIRMYNLGTDVVVRNNTFVGYLRDVTDARYKLWPALSVHTLAAGYDGSGLSVYNNIMVGRASLPSTAKTANNIFWAYSVQEDPHNFLFIPPDPGSKILTSSDRNYYPIDYFTNNYFLDILAESDFTHRHGNTLDFHLHAASEAVNFGDVNTQSSTSLGSIDVNGFIQDDGIARDAIHHSAGAYEYGP